MKIRILMDYIVTLVIIDLFTLFRLCVSSDICHSMYLHTIDLMQIWRSLISINLISSTKEVKPITRKSMSKLVTQPSFTAVGQTHGMVDI